MPEERLSFHAEPEAALAGVDFVQENAPERVEVKRALLARLDAALPTEVIIASSSSGLGVAATVRVAAGISETWMMPLLAASGILWIGTFVLFVLCYGPMLRLPESLDESRLG